MRLPLLTEGTVLAYLRERGLLKKNGYTRVCVRDLSRRNHNLIVKIDDRPAWFIKQIQYETPEVILGLTKEALCYQLAQAEESFASLRSLLPRCALFDHENCILVLECLDGVNAADAHQRIGFFDAQIAATLGKLVAGLHEASPSVLRSSLCNVLPGKLPWILEDAPIGNYPSRRSWFLSLFKADNKIAQAVSDLRQSWQRDTLIHGDARLENFFFCRPADEHGEISVRLVDWELADRGDAAWDCANVMQHYWTQWILSNPPTLKTWDGLQSALQHFCGAYTAGRAINTFDEAPTSRHMLLMTGARLLQTSYEYFASSGSWTALVERLARLARLLMTDPESSQIKLGQ